MLQTESFDAESSTGMLKRGERAKIMSSIVRGCPKKENKPENNQVEKKSTHHRMRSARGIAALVGNPFPVLEFTLLPLELLELIVLPARLLLLLSPSLRLDLE